MSISWRPNAGDPLSIYASAFPNRGEPYTLDFGGNDVRMMYPKLRPAEKTYPRAGTYLVVARTLESGLTAHTEVVVRSYRTPQFSVEALSARRVRMRIDHPGGDPVLYRVNWGSDDTWSDHDENELELEFVYPRTDTPPKITVMDVPALRSASKQAPVARSRQQRDEQAPPADVNVEVTVNVRCPQST